ESELGVADADNVARDECPLFHRLAVNEDDRARAAAGDARRLAQHRPPIADFNLAMVPRHLRIEQLRVGLEAPTDSEDAAFRQRIDPAGVRRGTLDHRELFADDDRGSAVALGRQSSGYAHRNSPASTVPELLGSSSTALLGWAAPSGTLFRKPRLGRGKGGPHRPTPDGDYGRAKQRNLLANDPALPGADPAPAGRLG